MREIDAAHCRGRGHREALCESEPDPIGVKERKEFGLLTVIRARRIAERRPNATERLRKQLVGVELLVEGVPLSACVGMEPFGECLG